VRKEIKHHPLLSLEIWDVFPHLPEALTMQRGGLADNKFYEVHGIEPGTQEIHSKC
jgi:hypothetical protein